MPVKNCIVNLPGFKLREVKGTNPLILKVTYHRKARCLNCQSKDLRKKARFIRKVAHETTSESLCSRKISAILTPKLIRMTRLKLGRDVLRPARTGPFWAARSASLKST